VCGKQFEFVSFRDRSRDEGPRNDRSKSFHCEHAIDWQPGQETARARWYSQTYFFERSLQLIEASASFGAHGNNRGRLEK
jgi:hypothetical protein